ncbi:MAG: 4Fe-4S binding protein [Cyanobacteria bacterium REEB417]|nr:4Fe-4S binding protein [Cyanobacteria bacterium REEB417]
MAAIDQQLAPYLVGRPRRGVVGGSRYAVALREAVRDAARDPDRRPVLIHGEPGLEKDNLAALIHHGSADRRQPMIRLDATLMKPDSGELRELLGRLGRGTVLIDKLDLADPALQPLLLEHLSQGDARWMFTSESALQPFEGVCRQIRVPPLRVRRQDLGDWLRYDVRQQSRRQGWPQPPAMAPGVVEQLQRHDFPNNLRELEAVVARALRQARNQQGGQRPRLLPEDVFWTEGRNQPLRFELWRWRPWLRTQLRAPALWNGLLFGLVSWLFVLVNLWLWLGPQDRAHNGALNLFWAWWWPLILLAYPLVGRLWCSFCPFMVWGEIAQRLAQALGRSLPRWPRGSSDDWASPLLAAGFAAILLWEELAGLETHARRSSLLLLLITAGAVVGSLLVEKRFWCRYLCPVGGMNGLFAKLSVLELRAEAGTCSGSCSSYACFKGGPADGEGLATAGCPLGTHPAHLTDNRNCVLCLTCAQACPHRSITLRLRPPAADLQRTMDPPAGEPGLILVLAGGICVHHSEALLGWVPALLARLTTDGGPLPWGGFPQEFLPRLALSSLALALPAGLWLLVRGAGLRLLPHHPRPWLLLYALLPLLWATLLADHLRLGMAEAGQLLPVSLSPLRQMEGFGIAEALAAFTLPGWSADEHVIRFCQSLTVALGAGGSLVLGRRLLLPDLRGWLGQGAALLGLAVAARALVGLG